MKASKVGIWCTVRNRHLLSFEEGCCLRSEVWIGGSWIPSAAVDTCRERTELLQCTQKEKLCCAMSLEGWMGARSHREAQIVTSIIFIILKRRSHCSIVGRWVTRSDIFIHWASTGKSTDERHGDKFHYYIWFICKSVS